MPTLGDILDSKYNSRTVKNTIKRWTGSWPANCDICEVKLTEHSYFVDGATKYGPWALMCPACHIHTGRGLGTGKGQKYSSKNGLIKLEG